ncbi:hypothetical protein [Flagellimonas flava]|uniref:hypothetical protein n=1 Tax=Flagellimonas flava TaxID=570519 RepID=UPI003D655AC0
MTHVELRDILVDRVGFRQPTSSTFTLDSTTIKTDSGRYFQDVHPVVTIKNIETSSQEIITDDTGMNSFLQNLTKAVCLQVVGDVFEVSNIDDNILTGRENIFDDAIGKRMAINVGELIINSTRSNHTETVNKELQQKTFFEVNGNEGNPKFPNYVGLKSRYGAAIEKLRDSLQQVRALDVDTLKLPNYNDTETILL